jgi:interferon gamma-inducible protein 30
MIKHGLIVIVSLLLFLQAQSAPVNIDVYTETLCPFSNKFITNSFTNFFLNPDRDNLANVNFYSFGNAYQIVENNTVSFVCQHGPAECLGNAVQSCGKYYLNKDNYYRLMICTASRANLYNKDFDQIAASCIPDAQLLNTILTCAKGNQGIRLQSNLFYTKPSVVNHTPFIVVNNIYNKNVESQIFNNMNQYLCSLGNNSQLSGCKALGH